MKRFTSNTSNDNRYLRAIYSKSTTYRKKAISSHTKLNISTIITSKRQFNTEDARATVIYPQLSRLPRMD